jgi:hypothetical protein
MKNSIYNNLTGFLAYAIAILIFGFSVLAFAGPASAEPNLKDYLTALSAAAKPLDGERSANFLSPGRDPEERPTLSASVDEMIRYYDDEMSRTLLSLEKAAVSPQAFTLGGTMNCKRGGMIVWRNDIFAADFFVRRHGAWQKAGSVNAGKLVSGLLCQPWFNLDGVSFVYRPSGAGARILQFMKAAAGKEKGLRLYRGTTDFEAQVLEIGRKLAARESLDPRWREELKTNLQKIADHAEKFYRAYEKGISEGWAKPADTEEKKQKWQAVVKRNQEIMRGAEWAKDDDQVRNFVRGTLTGILSQGEFCGIFTTPDRKRAKLFSKGRVVEFAPSWEALEGLLARGKLYVGFEKMYEGGDKESVQVEIGFMGAGGEEEAGRLVDIISRSYRGSSPEKPTELFN